MYKVMINNDCVYFGTDLLSALYYFQFGDDLILGAKKKIYKDGKLYGRN